MTFQLLLGLLAAGCAILSVGHGVREWFRNRREEREWREIERAIDEGREGWWKP